MERIAHRHAPLRTVAIVIVRYQVAEGDTIARDTLRLPSCCVSLDCRHRLAIQTVQTCLVGHLRVAQDKESKLLLLAICKWLQRKVVAILFRVISLIEGRLTKLALTNLVLGRNCDIDIPSIARWRQLVVALLICGNNRETVAHRHTLDRSAIGVAHITTHRTIGKQEVLFLLEALQATHCSTSIGNGLELANNTCLNSTAVPTELHLTTISIEELNCTDSYVCSRQCDIEHLLLCGREFKIGREMIGYAILSRRCSCQSCILAINTKLAR